MNAMNATHATHTAGPWIAHRLTGGEYQISGTISNDIPAVCTLIRSHTDTPVRDEDAALIAAAPELLAALEEAYAVMISARVEVYNHARGNYQAIEAAIDSARDAIAKAKGA